MSSERQSPAPGLGPLVQKIAGTGLGALRNRAELFALELQEERARRVEFGVFAVGFVLLLVLVIGLFTAIVLVLVRADARLYVAGGFALLYALGALACGFRLKRLIGLSAFPETVDQLKKDRQWLDSSK